MQKRLIEYDLPLADISEESAREKNIRFGHPSTLHIWWARRPLASSRTTAFAALIDDPGEENPKERKYLEDLIHRIAPWEAVKNGNSKAIEDARQLIKNQYGCPPRILDPFSGGGSIPLEAARLGCETYASDYNPVAVFIEKATLDWPQRFGIDVELPRDLVEGRLHETQMSFGKNSKTVKVNLLAYLVEKWANNVLEDARNEIGRFYPPDQDGWILVGYLWARTIHCQNPTCGAEIPLIKQFWLSKSDTKQVAYHPIIDKVSKHIDFEILENANEIKKCGLNPDKGFVIEGDAFCPICNQVTKTGEVRKQARQSNMGNRLIVVIYYHPGQVGKKYRIATDKDILLFQESKTSLENKLSTWPYLESPIPDEPIPTPDGKEYVHDGVYFNFTPVVLYGLTKWADLFNPRQKLAIITFMDKILGNQEGLINGCKSLAQNLNTRKNPAIDAHELASVVMGYLGIMLSKILDFGSSLCVLNNTGGRGVKNTFGRQALPMTWDYIETNVFNPAGASWCASIAQTLKVLDKSLYHGAGLISCILQSATNLKFPDNYFDAIFTDPPYYDNIPYAVLSDFFYVWQKKILGDILPDLFSTPTTPKQNEAIADFHSYGEWINYQLVKNWNI